MARSVIAENSVLDAWAADPSAAAAAPCLKALAPPAVSAGGCTPCKQAADRRRQDAYREARRCLVGLPEESRRALKAALGLDQVVVLVDGLRVAF